MEAIEMYEESKERKYIDELKEVEFTLSADGIVTGYFYNNEFNIVF